MPILTGGDTVRKINMATAGVSQLVFEYLIALVRVTRELRYEAIERPIGCYYIRLRFAAIR